MKKNADAWLEQQVYTQVTKICVLISSLSLLYLFWKKRPGVLSMIALLIFMERLSTEVQGYSHIVNDLTQMNGTILHHVPLWDGATSSYPGEGLKAMGDGMACTMFVTQFGYMFASYLIVKASRYDATIAMAMFWPVMNMSSLFQMRE